jgi:hypothetical protein
MTEVGLKIYRETAASRVAIGGGRRIEVLLQALPSGCVDLRRLQRVSELLGWLSFHEFRLVHEEGGWIACERECRGEDAEQDIATLLEALSSAGLD